jgi:CheY-like chemotaxis protein
MTILYSERRRVLLIDDNSRRLNLRAAILRNHEIEVHLAGRVEEARSLWKSIPYDLVLLAASENSEQAILVPQQIRKSKPRQRIALLVGPPTYIREIGRTGAAPKTQLIPPPPADAVSLQPQWPEIVQTVVNNWYVDRSSRFVLDKLTAPVASGPPFLTD